MVNLNPQQFPWMRSDAISALFNALPNGSLRFVGGCVRNALWDIDVGDIDLACQLEPKAVIDALEAAEIRHIPTGIDHGTVTAVVDGTPFEITSLRRDVETDGRQKFANFDLLAMQRSACRKIISVSCVFSGFWRGMAGMKK